MTDPDKYYYYNGAILVRRNLAAQTDTNIKTFPSALQAMGGTANYQDRTDRYFVVQFGGAVSLWDSQTNTTYTNTVSPLNWTGISPDGNFIVTQAGATATPNKEHYSYAINHGTTTVAASPVQYWGVGGDHGAIVSCSDGNSYGVLFDNHTTPGLYATNLTINNAGRTEAQQLASATLLLTLDFADIDGFISAISVGTFKDWIITAVDCADDRFSAQPSPWRIYSQEIIAVNVLTAARRRLAHHRSRQNAGFDYWNYPFIGSSADGSIVTWNSNYNRSSPAQCGNLYGIQSPLTDATAAPSINPRMSFSLP